MYSRFNVKQFCQRKIRKIRHRKGYGVHSPFAYGLITKVIEEKSGYYAYKQIEDLHRTLQDGYSTLYLQKGCPTARLFCIEPDPIRRATAEQLLMHLPGNVTYIDRTIPEGLSFLHGEELDQHLIYLHSLSDASQYQEAFEKISPHLCEKSIIIIDGIRQEKGIFRVWKNFSRNEKIRVTFDLYNLAIAICNPKLNKQNYIVAF